jgi:LmbE family N-acetylglucosaminyl deacetylase
MYILFFKDKYIKWDRLTDFLYECYSSVMVRFHACGRENRKHEKTPMKSLLGIFAHPDDEGTMGGALLKYGSQGVATGLICATRGEVGEIADPSLATSENLGQVREEEMRAAAKALGVEKLWFLGYRDSGMAGTAGNDDARAFVQVGSAEVVGKLVAIIRAFRPQVVVTFDENGAYGHPDHIAMYRLTTSAFHAAADAVQYPEHGAAHSVSKLYYSSFPRSVVFEMAAWLKEQNYTGTYGDLDPEKLGMPDDAIDVWLNVEQWQESKDRSWALHRTQAGTASFAAGLPEDLRRKWRMYECYQLAATRVGADVKGEDDLFAHV